MIEELLLGLLIGLQGFGFGFLFHELRRLRLAVGNVASQPARTAPAVLAPPASVTPHPVSSPPTRQGGKLHVIFMNNSGEKVGEDLIDPRQRRPSVVATLTINDEQHTGCYMASHQEIDGTWVYREVKG